MNQMKMNQLCMSSKIPRIALTSKQVVLQNNRITRATEKSVPIREELAKSVDNRFYPELLARSSGGQARDGCDDNKNRPIMRLSNQVTTYDYRGS